MAETGDQTIQLELPRDAALVLFDWIQRVEDAGSYRQIVRDSAEVVALWRLTGALEKVLAEPFHPAYEELVRAAAERLVAGHDPDPLSLY